MVGEQNITSEHVTPEQQPHTTSISSVKRWIEILSAHKLLVLALLTVISYFVYQSLYLPPDEIGVDIGSLILDGERRLVIRILVPIPEADRGYARVRAKINKTFNEEGARIDFVGIKTSGISFPDIRSPGLWFDTLVPADWLQGERTLTVTMGDEEAIFILKKDGETISFSGSPSPRILAQYQTPLRIDYNPRTNSEYGYCCFDPAFDPNRTIPVDQREILLAPADEATIKLSLQSQDRGNKLDKYFSQEEIKQLLLHVAKITGFEPISYGLKIIFADEVMLLRVSLPAGTITNPRGDIVQELSDKTKLVTAQSEYPNIRDGCWDISDFLPQESGKKVCFTVRPTGFNYVDETITMSIQSPNFSNEY